MQQANGNWTKNNPKESGTKVYTNMSILHLCSSAKTSLTISAN